VNRTTNDENASEDPYWSVHTDVAALTLFMLAFILLAVFFHHKTRDRAQ
jgi:hypothetical protein